MAFLSRGHFLTVDIVNRVETLNELKALMQHCKVWYAAACLVGNGTVLVFRLEFVLEDAIELHAFAPLEARPCV
jgi:hypothetical protein